MLRRFALIAVMVATVASSLYAQSDFSFLPNGPRKSTFANLSGVTDGAARYCTDCVATAPCTGAGTGAFGYRVGSAWNCNVGAPATGGSFVALDGSTIGATVNVQQFIAGVRVGDISTTAGTVDFANGSTGTLLRLRWDDVTHTAGTGRPIKIVLNGNIGIGGLTWTWRATSGTTAYLGDALSAFASTTSAGLASVVSDESGSGPLLFGTAPTIASPTINTGITSGTGFQHIRVASCTTGTLVNAACDTTITWPVAFADTSYTAGATLSDPSGGLVFILSEKSKTTTTMVVTLVTLTAAASSGTVNAWAFHD